jgi:uncharacterized membrane protein
MAVPIAQFRNRAAESRLHRMSAALAPNPWPTSPGAPRGAPWVFGREVMLDSGVRALQWLQKRNCSITPRQLGFVYFSLCCVSLLIGMFFFVQGAPVVLAFAGLELAAVGVAMLLCARHAGDRETLTLVGHSLQVEQRIGTRIARTDFAADWLAIEPAAGQGSLVELSGRGQLVRVGRFLRPELRSAFARELRLALRRPVSPDGPENDTN